MNVSIINRKIDSSELIEAISLLKEAVKFMNMVPNRKYGNGNHYELCSRIDKFLRK